jgi:hypothetical protein
VVGLVVIIDGEGELSYIDDDVPMKADKVESGAVAPEKHEVGSAETTDLTKGLGAKSPINLDSEHENVRNENSSLSPPPSFDEAVTNVQTLIGTSNAPGFRGNDLVPLETTSILILETLFFIIVF